MNNSRRKKIYILVTVLALILVGAIAMFSGVLTPNGGLVNVIEKLNENYVPTTAESQATLVAGEVGSEIYDLSMYEESSKEYDEALAQLEEDWFPRIVAVMPKGPKGGEYPNAPPPIYDAFPGQKGETADGETYTITRTWIGDIAVGTEVILEGVVQQGE